MHSLIGQTTYEFVEKKSRFIGLLYHIEEVSRVDDILNEVRLTYPGANHYVYAYVINQYSQKASDDGEPQRTAGYPILDVLIKNQLNDVLAIVVRYFGGTLLGSGGLIRAYTHAISEAIKKATLSKKVTLLDCTIKTSYPHLKDVEYLLKDHVEIKNINYLEDVEIHYYVSEEMHLLIKDKLYQANGFKDLITIHQEMVQYAKVLD
mgnify:CR=1 FL=1